MSHLSTMVRIEATATAVFDLIADPARSPEWQTMLAEMGDITGRPGGIGSSYVGFYRVAGRKLVSRFVVTAAERPTVFQVNGTTTGGWARWTTTIEPAGPSCEVHVNLEYEVPGEIVGSLLGLLTGNRINREFRRTYENLRRLAETGSAMVPGSADVAVPPETTTAPSLRSAAEDVEAREPGGLATT
jgi:ribosome-associated toxin RatA of RatAB toxin-antitoxin module